MTVFARLVLLGAIFFGEQSALLAADPVDLITLDLPVAADKALPVWLGRPVTSGDAFAALDVPIDPPDPNASLLMTVFYQEANGGFLRISWQDGTTPASVGALPGPGEVGASSVLCDNFYEGIGMNNQRTLLINAYTIKHAGALHFQAGGATLGVSRIKLEWLEKSTGLASPAITDMLVTSASMTTELASSLAGLPAMAADAEWHDRIVDVPVTDTPLRIEQGVDFTVHLNGPPIRARLALKETGLPPGQHLVVWLNNKRAGIVVPAVPDLADAGYSADSTDAPYVGWREGTILLPKDSLASGNNVLQFSAEADFGPGAAPGTGTNIDPLAVKDVDFQFEYPPSSVITTEAATFTPAMSPLSIPTPARAPAPSSTPGVDSPATLSIPPNNIAP